MKTLKMSLLGASVLAAMAVAGGASAATIDFDLAEGGTSANQASFAYASGGVDLTVSGIACGNQSSPNSGSCSAENIDRYADLGIGMDRGGPWWSPDNHQADGAGGNEFIKLTFDPEITLQSVTFTYYSSDDDFELYTWNGVNWTHEGQGDACTWWCGSASTPQTYTFAGTYTGSSFLIGAEEADDDWKLKAVSVTYEPSVVPLPASALLLLGGLGGLTALRRRKAKAA